MRYVFGTNVEGVYYSDLWEKAFDYPMEVHSYFDRHRLRAAEAFTEDGTLPCKVVIRVLANMDYLLFQEDAQDEPAVLHGSQVGTHHPRHLHRHASLLRDSGNA